MKKQRKHAERLAKIKPLINKYKWEGINLPSNKDDWEKFEKIMSQLLFVFCM